jgi:hypothetical protein
MPWWMETTTPSGGRVPPSLHEARQARVGAGRYALRAVNLFSLLGSQDQIEQKLLQSADEAPPEPYSAHIHRTSDRKQNRRRNPLTDQQYNDLRGERNSVSLIFWLKGSWS